MVNKTNTYFPQNKTRVGFLEKSYSPERCQVLTEWAIQYEGKYLVVIQMRSGPDSSWGSYVIVPGFLSADSQRTEQIKLEEKVNVEAVPNKERENVSGLVRKIGFKGPINFWND